jgi:hypothetical protein
MKRKWVYDHRRHGQRFAYRHGSYRFHHGGWWYDRAWWGPTVGFAVAPGMVEPGYAVDDEHVQWCMNRYRSYDPETDSFMGYDGMLHPCNSPY